ncbi:unnamed protein product, partial [Ranitomeya imitator]
GSRCLISCDEGKYYSIMKKECDPCHRSCATCSGPGIDNCLNCAKEMFFEDGRCVMSCGSQFYMAPPKANGFKTCKRCDGSCLSCSGPGDRNCTSCPDGYLLEGSTCLVGTVCKDATEEAWAEGGFCMLVKKNNLCIRKVLQQLCCRTCTLKV